MTAGQNTFLAVSDVFFSFLCVIFLLFRQKEEKWLKKCVIAALMLKGVISSALNYNETASNDTAQIDPTFLHC